jgi:hypothetical protein
MLRRLPNEEHAQPRERRPAPALDGRSRRHRRRARACIPRRSKRVRTPHTCANLRARPLSPRARTHVFGARSSAFAQKHERRLEPPALSLGTTCDRQLAIATRESRHRSQRRTGGVALFARERPSGKVRTDGRRAGPRSLSSPPAALTAQGAGMSFAEARALRRAAAAATAVDRVTNRRFADVEAALRPAAPDAVAVTRRSESSRRSR